jgi:NAD-dependent deacetylase
VTRAEDFAISPELSSAIDVAAERLIAAVYPIGLTGAGLSVESGIPPFRGPGGLWTEHGEPPMDGYQRFLRDPVGAWRELISPTEPWLKGLRDTLGQAAPNPGHRALVALETAGVLQCVITQNVDDLHRQAGQTQLLEIHGNYRLLRCVGCGERFPQGEIEIDPARLPPACPRCSAMLKDDTVHFGEPIPPRVLSACERAAERADCMLVVGTSATVYPAAGFAVDIARRGGCLIEVNPEESDLTEIASVFLRGPAGALLSALAERVTTRV